MGEIPVLEKHGGKPGLGRAGGCGRYLKSA